MVDDNKTVNVVRAAMELVDRDLRLKLVTLEQIRSIPRTRFAPADRKQLVALLKAEGKSNRDIAKELGVAHQTINNDLGGGKNLPKNGKKLPPDSESAPTADDPKLTAKEKREAKRDEKIQAQNTRSEFIITCGAAFEAASHVYRNGTPVDDEMIRACRGVIRVWMKLLNKLESLNGKDAPKTKATNEVAASIEGSQASC